MAIAGDIGEYVGRMAAGRGGNARIQRVGKGAGARDVQRAILAGKRGAESAGAMGGVADRAYGERITVRIAVGGEHVAAHGNGLAHYDRKGKGIGDDRAGTQADLGSPEPIVYRMAENGDVALVQPNMALALIEAQVERLLASFRDCQSEK